ncbi:restriction endonuclease [Candidatus Nitromaritima sp. SCGC AAA799-C22]|nr:restriction endonuclease [Candidatus Nitromaritima sp. SCGC AAA799-C22]
MPKNKNNRAEKIVKAIPLLTEGQLYWLDRVIQVFNSSQQFKILHSDLFDQNTLENFGDALRIHHSFSMEPFSKDKFEYILEKVLKMSGHQASLAPKGNRGHDISINGCPISLKTQANKGIREDKIWISKFMELGKGKWGDDEKDLIGLRKMFLGHLKNYKRILILRALEKGPQWHYELVEIPINLMKSAQKGELELKKKSKQFPKPGYCHVRTTKGENIYQLYFDAGSERKLQVKNLLKSYCKVHATWEFFMPPE